MENTLFVILGFVVMLIWIIHTRLIKADKNTKFKIGLNYFIAFIIMVAVTVAILYWHNVLS